MLTATESTAENIAETSAATSARLSPSIAPKIISRKLTLPSGNPITLTVDTDYPRGGNIKIALGMKEPEAFSIKLRNPEWSKTTEVRFNGTPCEVSDGYITLDGEFASGDVIELSLDMRVQAILPIPYGEQILMNEVIWGANYMISTFDREDPIAHRHIALRRGPVMLAQENRLGYSVDEPVDIAVNPDGYVDAELCENLSPYKCILEAKVPLSDGSTMLVTDYASAGKLWNEESKMAVWMLTK